MTVRIAALFFGLIAGLFALVAPSALKTDLMAAFLELFAGNPSERLLATIAWYAVPGAALLGAFLALFMPGFASLLLLAAAAGWVTIGVMLPGLFDFQLLAPAGAAAVAATLAFVAGELQLRRRRQRRRSRRLGTETLVDEEEFEREAALRIDPLVVPRDEVPPPPRRAIPLTLADVSVSEKPTAPPPRWEDLDAPGGARRGSDMWAEAIRPEPEPEPPAPDEYVPEPEPRYEPETEPLPPPEPEPYVMPRRGPAVRGFRWDDEDVPPGQNRDPAPAPGPRLEPRRPTAPGPQFTQRKSGPAPEARRPEPIEPTELVPNPEPLAPLELEPKRPEAPQQQEARRPDPAPTAQPRPQHIPRQPSRGDAEGWPEPQMRRPMPAFDDDKPRSSLVAAAAVAAAVLVVGLALAGGYLAVQQGWLGPPTSATARVAPSDGSTQSATPDAQPVTDASSQPATAVTNVAAPAGAIPAPPAPATEGADPADQQPAPAQATAEAEPTPAPKTFADPFTYCRAVGTIDYVDSRYSGPAVIEAITRTLSLPETASRDRLRWRCVRGAVLACTSYGGPVCDMTPTVDEMRAFCAKNQNVGPLLAPSGAWSCAGGKPQLPAEASWPVDERGFLPNAWVVVRPDALPPG